MDLQSILSQYLGGNAAADNVDTHFSQVAGAVPRESLGQGLADAFRSDATPPFGDMVGQLFGRSSPEQRAGMLNQLIAGLGPGVAGGLLSRVLGGALGGAGAGGGMPGSASTGGAMGGGWNTSAAPALPQITPAQAQQVSPEQVSEIAAQAERHNPGIVDQLGHFYADHPDVVRALGAAALSIVMARLANRNRG